MSTTVTLRRKGRSLYPVDPVSEDLLLEIGAERDVVCEIKVARSAKQLRWLFCLLHLVADNADDWDGDVDDLLTWLKVSARMIEPVLGHDGELIYVLKSISFAGMGQEKFNRTINRFLEIIERRWPHLHREHMRAEADRVFASFGFERQKEKKRASHDET